MKKRWVASYFEGQSELKPSEFQEWRSKLLEACHKRAVDIFKSQLNGLNSEQRAIMERSKLS